MVNMYSYSLLVLLSSVLPAACMLRLAKHFIERKQIVTLLLVIFFGMFSATYIVYYLILIDVFQLDVTSYLLFTSLIYFAVILLVGLVMLKLRELYLLPELIVTIAAIHYNILDSSNTSLANMLHFISYTLTGHLIGQEWFLIPSRTYDPSFLQNFPYFENIKPFLNPLSIIIPDIPILAMGIYITLLSAPTIILFYYIAWKNKSGRSLGFALGLTILEINMAYWLPVETHALITITATAIFTLGIFGILNKIIEKIERQKIVTQT
ncbi:MAG: hypothetical protein QXO71_05355 [Candidatus Jordarchaeaceae archaeon]